MSLATWLGPLRQFVLAHPWDVEVWDDVPFCWSVARRAERKQNGMSSGGYSLGFFRSVLRKRYDSEPVSMMCA
jgi:hypothetical protein